jgi:hypothetical protein
VFTRKLKFLRENAAALFLRPPFVKIKLLCLQRIFGFAKSNVISTHLDERYKTAAVDLVSTLKPETVVEFGSGLGGIVERLAAPNRIGFDRDKGAAAAARFLHGAKPNYFHASFLEPDIVVRMLLATNIQTIDVLVLTNWIHKVPTDKILRGLASIHARIPIRYLLLETIKPEFTGCDHQLSISDLARFGEVLHGIEAGEVSSLHIVTMADFESNQLLRLRQAVGSSSPYTSTQS